MTVNGVSTISNALSMMYSIIQEANEPPYITEQKAARGDMSAINRLQEEQDEEELMARLIKGSSQEDSGSLFDLFA